MDSNNYIRSQRKKYLETEDAETLLEYLNNKQAQDPSFFYAVQVDKENGRIANFFWADGQSIMDYASFGDVISFDTHFQQINLKCHLLLFLVLTITRRQLFLVQHCCSTKPMSRLCGFLAPSCKQCPVKSQKQFLLTSVLQL